MKNQITEFLLFNSDIWINDFNLIPDCLNLHKRSDAPFYIMVIKLISFITHLACNVSI